MGARSGGTVKRKDASERILSAAFKCISARGSAGVSLRDIAQEAGVALSQLNYYYENREQLFAAVLKAMKQEYVTGVEERIGSRGTLKERARALLDYNRDLLRSNKRLYRAFLDFFGLAMWSRPFQEEMAGFLGEISRAIEHQIHPSAKKPGAPDSAALATLILGVSFGIAIQYLVEPDREELLDGFDVLLGMV